MRRRHIPATREGTRGIVATRFFILFSRSSFYSVVEFVYDTATTVNASKRKTLMISISVAIDALV